MTTTVELRKCLRAAAAVFAASFVLTSPPVSAEAVTGFDVVEVVASLESATDLEFLPDGRALITTKPGIVEVIENDVNLPGVALDLTSVVCTNGERGLVGVAVHPNFTVTGWVYLYYTYPTLGFCGTSETTAPINRASRFTMAGNTIDPASEVVLIESPPLVRGIHNSGSMEFGKDGYLYISMGDSGYPTTPNRPQDPGWLLGKVVRITDTGAVPPGNPYTGPSSADCSSVGRIPDGSAATQCQQVYASGLRNPFRLAFDPNAPTTTFFINDVGQAIWEEISLGAPGADYGWPEREGPCKNGSASDCAIPAASTDPVHWYQHDGGAAVTGGAFVPDGLWPVAYDGLYLYSDFVENIVYAMKPGGPDCRTCTPPTSPYLSEVFLDGVESERLVNMRFGPHQGSQALYLLSATGGLSRVTYVGDANATPIAAAEATPLAGALPLEVQFIGSNSSDPDGDVLTYLWDFGDGATSTEADPVKTYFVSGTYYPSLTVDDGQGATATKSLRVDPGNNAPAVVLDSPLVGTTFAVGESLTLSATASDIEDGPLADSQLSWEVRLHHNTHSHPLLPPTTGNNFTVVGPEPEDIDAAATSYLEVIVTAVDSGGVETTVSLDVQPTVTNLRFETSPAGLEVAVDNFVMTGPSDVVTWQGQQVAVGVETEQTVDGVTYYWTGWSQGGAPTQTITSGNDPETYAANFSSTPPAAPRVVPGWVGDVTEGDPGTQTVQIPVTLNRAVETSVTVDWQSIYGVGGTESDDFASASGTVTFGPYETTESIALTINGDSTYEPLEYAIVMFSNPTGGAVLGGFFGLGGVALPNDDAPPVGTVGSVVVAEGDASSDFAMIDVTLDAPSEVTARFSWTTFDYSATSPEDFESTAGIVVFAPGETTATLSVPIVDDLVPEGPEGFFVFINNPVAARVVGYSWLGGVLIEDND